MASSPTIIDMPADIMETVLKYVDFQNLQALRKVSSDLRNYIDDAVPISNLFTLGIDAKPDNIRFKIDSDSSYVEIVYKKHKDGCLVVCGKKEKLLKNEDFVTISGRDLQSILRHHKSIMNSVQLSFPSLDNEQMLPISTEFLGSFQTYLQSRDQPLQTKNFKFEKTDQRQILMVLPYLDSKTLKALHITNDDENLGPLKIDQIIMLDQWKNAENLKISNYIIPTPIASFAHFKKAEISVDSISLEDMLQWREVLLHNNPSEEFKLRIEYKNFANEKQFMESFGQIIILYLENNPVWYFRVPQSDNVLSITLNDGIAFDYISLNDIPEGFLTEL